MKKKAKYFIQLFEDEAKKQNITYEYIFKENRGEALYEKRHIRTCKPVSISTLRTSFHEIAHITNKVPDNTPRYLDEYLTEIATINLLKKIGVNLSKKLLAKTRAFLASRVQIAIARGLKTLDKRVKEYIEKDFPQTANLIPEEIPFWYEEAH